MSQSKGSLAPTKLEGDFVLVATTGPGHLVLRAEHEEQELRDVQVQLRELLQGSHPGASAQDDVFAVNLRGRWHRAQRMAGDRILLIDEEKETKAPRDQRWTLPHKLHPDQKKPLARRAHLSRVEPEGEDWPEEAIRHLSDLKGTTMAIVCADCPDFLPSGHWSWPIDVQIQTTVAENPFAPARKVVKSITTEMVSNGWARLKGLVEVQDPPDNWKEEARRQLELEEEAKSGGGHSSTSNGMTSQVTIEAVKVLGLIW